MVLNIDYDRGVHKRQHRSGLDVYMYVDDPGVYLSAHGTPLSEQFATEAGYDVVELGKKRRLKERLTAANERIRAEMELAESGERKVVAKKNGFRIFDTGVGTYHVESPDGDVLTRAPVPREQADMIFAALTQGPDAPTDPDAS